jgi:hypothetical protein
VADRPPQNTITIFTSENVRHRVQVYHLVKEARVRNSVDMSTLSTQGGSSVDFFHNRLPAEASGRIDLKGGLKYLGIETIPPFPSVQAAGSVTGSLFTQTSGSHQQVAALRSLIGKRVTVAFRGSPPQGITGIFREAETDADFNWDDGVSFTFQIREDLNGGPLTEADVGAVFGTIVPILVKPPPDSDMVGAGGHACEPTTKRVSGAALDPTIRLFDTFGDIAKQTWVAIKTIPKAVDAVIDETVEAVGDAFSAAGDVILTLSDSLGITRKVEVPCGS